MITKAFKIPLERLSDETMVALCHWAALCCDVTVVVVAVRNHLPASWLQRSVGFGQILGASWQMNIWWALMAALSSTPRRCRSSPLAAGAASSSLPPPVNFGSRRLAAPHNSCLWLHRAGPGRGGAVAIKQTPATKKNCSSERTSSHPPVSLSARCHRYRPRPSAPCPAREPVIAKVSASPAVPESVTLHAYIWMDVSIFASRRADKKQSVCGPFAMRRLRS